MGSTDTEMNWTKDHRHQPTSSEQTLAQRREHPYIWATWLPRLLTGENSCEWAVWFKAHYQDWARTPSEFNQAEWLLNHTALLNKRKADCKHGGFDVNIEYAIPRALEQYRDFNSINGAAVGSTPDLGRYGDGVQRRRITRVSSGLDQHLHHFLLGEAHPRAGPQ